MKDLIEAFQIFAKYSNDHNPTNCSHDVLFVNVSPKLVSENEKTRLKELGFFVSEDSEFEGGFISFRFGSC